MSESNSDTLIPAARLAAKRKAKETKKVKGLPVPAGVTFLYLGRLSKSVPALFRPPSGRFGHAGVITVAMIIPEPTRLHLGLAFCSPEDPWCKVKGRDMALARLFLTPVVVPFLDEPQRVTTWVVSALVRRDFATIRKFALSLPGDIETLVPGWTKKLSPYLTYPFRRRQRRPTQEFADEAAPVLNNYPPGGIRTPEAKILFNMIRDLAKLDPR